MEQPCGLFHPENPRQGFSDVTRSGACIPIPLCNMQIADLLFNTFGRTVHDSAPFCFVLISPARQLQAYTCRSARRIQARRP